MLAHLHMPFAHTRASTCHSHTHTSTHTHKHTPFTYSNTPTSTHHPLTLAPTHSPFIPQTFQTLIFKNAPRLIDFFLQLKTQLIYYLTHSLFSFQDWMLLYPKAVNFILAGFQKTKDFWRKKFLSISILTSNEIFGLFRIRSFLKQLSELGSIRCKQSVRWQRLSQMRDVWLW